MILPIRSASLITLCGAAIFCSALFAQFDPALSNYPSLENSHGMLGNPALLGATDGPGWIAVYRRDSAEFKGYSTAFAIHGENSGISFLRSRRDPGQGLVDLTQWSLDLNIPFFDERASLALRNTLERSSQYSGNQFQWSPGLMVHPFNWLSMGWVWNQAATLGAGSTHSQHQLGLSTRLNSYPLIFSMNYSTENFSQGSFKANKAQIALGTTFMGANAILQTQLGRHFLKDPGMEFHLTLPIGSRHEVSAGFNSTDVFQSLSLSGHLSPRPSRMAPAIVRFAFNEPLVESESGFSWFSNPSMSLANLKRQFRHLSNHPSIHGVLFDFSEYQGNSAFAWEVRRGIQELKSKGKKTWAYMDELRPGLMIAASAADHIAIQPSARMHLRGLSSNNLYFKGLLDKLGIQAEMVRHGRWKSAVEPWTQDSMSKESREDLEQLLGSLWQVMRDSVARSRIMTTAKLDSIANASDLTAKAAVQSHLVDTALYYDDLTQWVSWPGKQIPTWKNLKRDLLDDSWAGRSSIVVLHIQGNIVDGPSSSGGLWSGASAGDRSLSQTVDQLRQNKNMKALVLRINSPGGSAQASDVIWNRIQRLGSDLGIPVVASISAVAASGGYYIACAADQIVAEPTSIVGSIGVFGGKVNLSGFLNKLGVQSDGVKTHGKADAESPYRGFTNEERLIVQAGMDDFYHRFLGIVAKARKTTPEHIDSLGEGRVFTGVHAIQNGLVDQIGGIDDAIKLAAKLAKINSTDRIRIEHLGSDTSWPMDQGLMPSQSQWIKWFDDLQKTQIWALWSPAGLREFQ